MVIVAEAPGDEDERCTSAESAPTYPDTVRNLMDSYNYMQLLPGSGTGNPPIEGAVWTDRSVDGNDAIGTTSPTYVSLQFLHRATLTINCVPIPVAAWRWRNMSISSTSLWRERLSRPGQLALHSTH